MRRVTLISTRTRRRSREYKTNARNISRARTALAAARLARLLNNALK